MNKNSVKYKPMIYNLGYSLAQYRGSWLAFAVNTNTYPEMWEAHCLENLYSSLKGFKGGY